ncbi:hypothetical protein ACR0ST_04810 [Aliidiomarina sp. Khilg15.8]
MSDDPYIRGFGNDAIAEDLNDDVKNKQLSYLGRYLVKIDTRQEVVANAYDQEFLESWSSVEYGTMTSMITDLAVGDLGSALGSELGAIVSLGGMLMGAAFTSDHDVIGQAWLPETFNGQTIGSPAAAHTAFSTLTEQRMAVIGEKFGYDVSCLGACGERSKVFEFVRLSPPAHDKPHGFEPHKFSAIVHVSAAFETIEENDILPIMTGQPVRWKLPPYYTLRMGFYTDEKRDESGGLIVETQEGDGYTIETVQARRDLLNVPFGRMVMQTFHATPYTLHASDDIYPSQLFYNGEAFTFFDGSNPLIIKKKVVQQYGG